MNRTLSALAAVALATGTLAAPAYAASADDSVSISLEGLNPADPADAVRIDRRVRNAAATLCGANLIQPIRMRERAAACEAGVIADARDAVELAAAKQSTPLRLALRVR